MKILRNRIILGIGIVITLLALAGIGSARFAYQSDCSFCHDDYPRPLTADGIFFNETHKFNGVSRPASADSCTECHADPGNAVAGNFTLVGSGPSYNSTHRYNATTLGSKMLSSSGCGSCHVDAVGGNFTLLSGTPTYLTSSVCEACHKVKYDDWKNTMHRVMLTKNTSAAVMNLTVPDGKNWSTTNVSYMIVGKSSFRYLNETGYFFKKYDVLTQTFASYGPSQYACGSCHTTGYNATGGNQSGLPGIIGTWNEEGIGCERCHKPAGNGHQVVVNYSGLLCSECHSGSHGTSWELSVHDNTGHSGGAGNTCSLCHQPFNNYKNSSVNPSPSGQSCAVCHNPHNTTDDQYAPLFETNGFNATVMEDVKDVKLSFFNSTASFVALTDIYDTLTTPVLLFAGTNYRKYNTYGSEPINVTGPVSEVLCSMCHYEHGLGPRYIANVSLSHGRNTTTNITKWATCTDCHYQGAGGGSNHSLNTDDVTTSCSRGTECHVTSEQNLSASSYSIVPEEREWSESVHNDKDNGFYNNDSYFANQTGFSSSGSPNRNNSDCMKCHSPFEWNPNTTISNVSDFKGITCSVCHNIHDMGEWINRTGKVYAWFNRDAFVTTSSSGSKTYIRNYSVMANTTELCGNCHSMDNPRIYNAGPGWNKTTDASPMSPHGRPSKDIFVGSWKQTSTLKFECIDCHMYINKTNSTGGLLNDSEKITGHSFAVNATGLQSQSGCKGCHDGIYLKEIPDLIEEIQSEYDTNYAAANTIVTNALNNIKANNSEKNLSLDMIAQAYWKLRMTRSDASKGVHNPDGVNDLLTEASALATAANQSLGRANTTVPLYAGWNLVSLNETPANTTPIAVLSSVSSNLTVVWGLNASTQEWLVYDPAPGFASTNNLVRMVKGESYEIKVASNCTWVV